MEISQRQPVTEQEIREYAKHLIRTSKSLREAERKSGLSRAILLGLASDATVAPASFALARERCFHGPAMPVAISNQTAGLRAHKP